MNKSEFFTLVVWSGVLCPSPPGKNKTLSHDFGKSFLNKTKGKGSGGGGRDLPTTKMETSTTHLIAQRTGQNIRSFVFGVGRAAAKHFFKIWQQKIILPYTKKG